MGGAGAVDPDQHLAAGTAVGVERQLSQGFTDDSDVVSGRVGAGVPGAQHHRQRFTGPVRAVIEERPQRVEPEPLLVL